MMKQMVLAIGVNPGRKPFQRSLTMFLLAFGVVLLSGSAWAESAIAIRAVEEFQKIGNDAAFPSDGHYVLTQNLDAYATAEWNYVDGFSSINDFQGEFGA